MIIPTYLPTYLSTTPTIGLHVDCCLGGFVLPFAKKLGYIIPGEMRYVIIML